MWVGGRREGNGTVVGVYWGFLRDRPEAGAVTHVTASSSWQPCEVGVISFPSVTDQENDRQRWKDWPEVSQGKVVQLRCKFRCDCEVHALDHDAMCVWAGRRSRTP